MYSEKLFVYGTLRVDYGLKLMKEIAGSVIYTGNGKIKGRLYDLGSYPAAVKGERNEEIYGDVYDVLNPVNVWLILDEYEGDEYKREKTRVIMETGEEVEAWVYWYKCRTDKALLVKETDYLDYLKNKKDRFV